MKFYYINPDYIKYLKSVDDKVQNNYDEKQNRHTKPYVGVIISIKDKEYYAPLTSNSPLKKARQKFEKMSDKTKTIHKIKDKNDAILAVISINNMIPVTKALIEEVDFKNIEDRKYTELMKKEIKYINSTQDELINKAKFLYKQVCFARNERYIKDCCQFKLLELACEQYISK